MRMYRLADGLNAEGWPFLSEGHAYLADGTPLTESDRHGRTVPAFSTLVINKVMRRMQKLWFWCGARFSWSQDWTTSRECPVWRGIGSGTQIPDRIESGFRFPCTTCILHGTLVTDQRARIVGAGLRLRSSQKSTYRL